MSREQRNKNIVNKYMIVISIFHILALILFAGSVYTNIAYDKHDVNKDGNVDIKDLLELQKYILENEER